MTRKEIFGVMSNDLIVEKLIEHIYSNINYIPRIESLDSSFRNIVYFNNKIKDIMVNILGVKNYHGLINSGVSRFYLKEILKYQRSIISNGNIIKNYIKKNIITDEYNRKINVSIPL